MSETPDRAKGGYFGISEYGKNPRSVRIPATSVPREAQGLKLSEVAAEMGRSEAAVAGLLFRGLRTLHTLLEE